MNISVVIPVFNEQDNIHPTAAGVRSAMARLGQPYEVLFIDDGSTDRTAERVKQIAAEDRCVKLVRFRRNHGQTAALVAGLQAAAGDVVITMDGDLQNDPADIPMMVSTLNEGFDLVHGWRKQRHDAMLSRRLPSRVANWLISKVTRFPVHDLGCTLKAMRRETARDLRLYGEMHRFIPILAHWQGARCAEVVTQHHARRFGQSKYGLWRVFRVLLDLVTVKFLVHYSPSPMQLFGGIGFVCLGGGSLSALAALAMKLFGAVDMTGNPLLLLSVFASMVGIQFLVLGLLAEICSRIFYELLDKRLFSVRERVNFGPADEEDDSSAAEPVSLRHAA